MDGGRAPRSGRALVLALVVDEPGDAPAQAPDALRGRVLSLYLLVFGGLQPIGSLLSGWLASIGGTRLAFLVAGGSLSLVAAYDVTRIRSLKEQEPRGRPTDYVEPLV